MNRVQLALYLVVVLALVGFGIYLKKGYDAIQELKAVQAQRATELDLATKTDETVAEKIETEAKANQELAKVSNKREELRRANPSYNEHLAKSLPAESVRLYELAGAIEYGLPPEHPLANRPRAGAEQEN